MPVFIEEIPEVHLSITRPITFSIIDDLLKRTGMSYTTRIRYIGNSEALTQVGSTIDRDIRPNRLPTDQVIEIELSEQFEASGIISANPKNLDYPPIFVDDTTGTTLTPAYQLIEVNASVSLRCKDSVTASNWMRSIRANIAQDVNTYLHVAEYHYVIPTNLMTLITHIYNMRETSFGYGQTLEQFLDQSFGKDMTVIRDSAGNNPVFAIRQTQGNITGWFDFGADVPKPERINDGTYVISFSYNFMYARCDHVIMRCPLVIHNQMLPVNLAKDVVLADVLEYYNQPTKTKNLMTTGLQNPILQKAWIRFCGVPYPFFDDWFPPQDLPNHANLLRLLIQIDVNQPTDVIDLLDLPHWTFRPHFITYMQKRPNSLLTRYDNIFYIRLFEKHDVFTDVIITPDLKIKTTRPLDPRKYYHVCIDLLTDPTLLTEQGKVDYTDDPDIVKEHIGVLDPETQIDYDEDEDLFTVTKPNRPPFVCIPPTAVTLPKVIDQISPVTGKPNDVYMFTVGLFSIVAHRSE